jgi:hypothetical protein
LADPLLKIKTMSTIPKDIMDLAVAYRDNKLLNKTEDFYDAVLYGYQLATDGREELENRIYGLEMINNAHQQLIEETYKPQITALQSSLKEKESRISGLVFATEQWEKKYDAKEKECESSHLNIDELLQAFKRVGFDTSNWDGDEGAEKAIVDGVCKFIDDKTEWWANELANMQIERNDYRNKSEELKAENERLKKVLGEFMEAFELAYPHLAKSGIEEMYESAKQLLNK